MPLRDHFRAPLRTTRSWEGLHGMWPGVIVQKLNAILPPQYAAEPRVHLGTTFEVDIGAYEQEAPSSWPSAAGKNGGVALATWAPPRPSVLVESELPTPSEYEVLVFDVESGRRLVAAIEIVSPSNKDRPEHRRSFVYKCEALLRKDVSVALVDVVTTCSANLFSELAELLGAPDANRPSAPLYAVACRGVRHGTRWRVETWDHELTLGAPLPTLPLWLSDSLAFPLPLEESYEDACRALRIP